MASKKPANTKLKQQKLNSIRPVLTLKFSSITLLSISVLCIILGIYFLIRSSTIVEVTKRYDSIKDCQANSQNPSTCTISITIDDDMTEPIFFYYELHNMYQNHRNFVKSRDYEQLKGEDRSKDDIDKCDPVKEVGDLHIWQRRNLDQELLDTDSVANPCGIAAKSIFTDVYIIENKAGEQIKIKEKDIAWESDMEYRFKHPDDYVSVQWYDNNNEHLSVWMKEAPMPIFRKLWGIIEQDLDQGDYKITVVNQFEVDDWDGQKWIVLSTANEIGGKNDFLGIFYLAAAGLAIIIVILGIIYDCIKKPGKEVELENLIWT